MRQLLLGQVDPLIVCKQALAAKLHVPMDDPTMHAVAAAYMDAANSVYQVMAHGHGSVRFYIANGWIENHAQEFSHLPDPQHRKPGK